MIPKCFLKTPFFELPVGPSREGGKNNEKVKKIKNNKRKTNQKREGGPRAPQGAPSLSLFVGFPLVFHAFLHFFIAFPAPAAAPPEKNFWLILPIGLTLLLQNPTVFS